MLLAGTQVLADRQHLHMVLAQHAEGLDHLLVGLAESDHQAGLRRHLIAPELLRVAQHPGRAEEDGAAPRDRVEPRNDLDVVVEDVGARFDHTRERHLLALEVRRQNLDQAAGRLAADLADHTDEGRGAEVRQVVAID